MNSLNRDTKPNGWEERFDEQFSYNNAPMKILDDKGNHITPEPMRYELKSFISQVIQSAEERGKREAFEEIVTLRSVYVYDDYSTLYQQSEKIWVEYSKVEGEFLKEKLSISTPGQEQLSNKQNR